MHMTHFVEPAWLLLLLLLLLTRGIAARWLPAWDVSFVLALWTFAPAADQ